MALPRNWWNVDNIEDPDQKMAAITIFLKDIYSVINKNVAVSENLKGGLVTVQFTAANTDTQVRHQLAFVPQNYFVCGLSAEMVIYDATRANDNSFAYLRSSAIGTARVFLF